jgi:hypothetical protein
MASIIIESAAGQRHCRRAALYGAAVPVAARVGWHWCGVCLKCYVACPPHVACLRMCCIILAGASVPACRLRSKPTGALAALLAGFFRLLLE